MFEHFFSLVGPAFTAFLLLSIFFVAVSVVVLGDLADPRSELRPFLRALPRLRSLLALPRPLIAATATPTPIPASGRDRAGSDPELDERR